MVGNNLAMLFLKAPFDPEMTSSAGTYNQGIDYFMQPSTRSLGFAVKVHFGGSTASKAAPASAPVYVPSEPKVVEDRRESGGEGSGQGSREGSQGPGREFLQ